MRDVIDSVYPNVPGFENRQTSYDAARTVKAEALRALVMSLHRQHIVSGMTDDELDQFKPANCPTLRPRRCELTRKGLLIDTGRRRFSKQHRLMIVWGMT